MSDLILCAWGFYDLGFDSASSPHGLISPDNTIFYPDRGARNLRPGREGYSFSSPYAVPLCKTENYVLCTRGSGPALLQPGGAVYFAPLRDYYTAHSDDPVPSSTDGIWGAVQLPQSTGPITDSIISGAIASSYWPVAMSLEGDRALVLLRNSGEILLVLVEPDMAPKFGYCTNFPTAVPIPAGIGIDGAGNVRVAVTNGSYSASGGIGISATAAWVSAPIQLSSLSGAGVEMNFGLPSTPMFSNWRATGTAGAIANSFGGNFIKCVATGPWASSSEGSASGRGVIQVLGTPLGSSMFRAHMVKPISAPSNERGPIFDFDSLGFSIPLEVCSVDIELSASGQITRPSGSDFGPAIWTPSADMQALWPNNPGVYWVGIDTPTIAAITPPFWTDFKRSIEVV